MNPIGVFQRCVFMAPAGGLRKLLLCQSTTASIYLFIQYTPCSLWSLPAVKALVPVAPGLGLGAPSKVSHRLYFQLEVPFAKGKWPCLLKVETPLL